MNFSLFLSIFLLFTVSITEYDVVLWFYDLTELPDNWLNYRFTFSSNGALIDVVGWFYPDSTRAKQLFGFLLSDYTIIPPGIDSVTIDVQQFVYLTHNSPISGGALAELNVEINGCDTLTLWNRLVNASQTSLTDSLPIHAVITDLSPGDLIQFKFYVYLWGFNSSAGCYWLLSDAQLTGYGELSLLPRTWAGIKSAL